MAHAVVYRRRVGRELDDAYRWYEDQRVGLGDAFLAAVKAACDAIPEYPERAVRVHGDVRRVGVARFPYTVFNVVEPSRIVVLAVMHGARNPKLWPRGNA